MHGKCHQNINFWNYFLEFESGNEHMQRRALQEDFKRREREHNAARAEERQAKLTKI